MVEIVIIRNVSISDLKNLKKLLRAKELGWGCSMKYFKRLIFNEGKGAIFLVAEYKFNIIGVVYGEYNKEEDWAELMGITVAENYREQGIGSNLIREFERIVCGKGVRTVELSANINTLAKNIHKLGYEKGNTYIDYRKKLF